jgi:hypothetical protein
MRSYWIIAAIIIGLSSCTKDKAYYKAPKIILCDSIHVSYQSCVKPIFVSNCYGCHSDSASEGGTIAFDIENFTLLKTYLNYYYHNDSVYGSKFMREINQQSGVLIMPPTYKMSDSDILIIKYWIANGAPDN